MTPAPVSPLPVPPPLPSSLTPSTIAAFIGSTAVFIIGLLGFAGVIVPANVTGDVQTWSSVLVSLAGFAGGIVTYVRHQSTVTKIAVAHYAAVASIHAAGFGS